jgi:hypothetical protein
MTRRRNGGRLSFAGLAVLLVGVAVGCHRSHPPLLPRVASLEIVDRSPAGGLDRGALGARASAALGKAGVFEVLPQGQSRPLGEGQTAWRCRLEVAAAPEQAGGETLLRAAVQAECSPTGGGASADALSARALTDEKFIGPAGSRDTRLRELAGRLLEDTVGLLTRQQRLRVGPMAELLTALADPDADVRRQAVRAAAFRRAHEAAPLLVKLLDDPQEDLRDMALGALADIADPAAVKAITARVKFGDVDELRKIIDPVAAMGGEEAHTFLEFVASGHEDADIRTQARTALERMDRRAVTQRSAARP